MFFNIALTRNIIAIQITIPASTLQYCSCTTTVPIKIMPTEEIHHTITRTTGYIEISLQSMYTYNSIIVHSTPLFCIMSCADLRVGGLDQPRKFKFPKICLGPPPLKLKISLRPPSPERNFLDLAIKILYCYMELICTHSISLCNCTSLIFLV